jgi:hypothetical protein
MNNIAISPHIFMYALQNQNVERKTAKQIDIKTLQEKEVVENNETTNISELNTSSHGEEIVTSEIVENEISITDLLPVKSENNVEIDINNQFVSSI